MTLIFSEAMYTFDKHSKDQEKWLILKTKGLTLRYGHDLDACFGTIAHINSTHLHVGLCMTPTLILHAKMQSIRKLIWCFSSLLMN